MDKIDLDAILKKVGLLPGNRGEGEYSKACIKEAIRQALVLASEELDKYIEKLKGQSFKGWKASQEQAYLTATTSIQIQGKKSILDVEKLIV